MDFDRYFTVNEQDLHNASYSSGDWEYSDDASHEQTGRLQIRLEDSPSTSPTNRHRPQLEAKPLPPVPEEPEVVAMPKSRSQTAAPPRRLAKASATKTAGTDSQQRSPRRGSGSSSECSPSQQTEHLSLWPKTHPSDVRKPGRICTNTMQRQVDDSSYHPDFESPHSRENCDLDQWAIDIYGPQDCAMTSLREKRRGVSAKSPLLEQYKEQMPAINKSPRAKHYPDSAYCSSTSASSTDNEHSTSPTSPSDTPADGSERGRSEDTAPASFFEDDDNEESKCLSEVRPPAKKFWRKMASSLRSTKSKTNLRGQSTSLVGMPMISA